MEIESISTLDLLKKYHGIYLESFYFDLQNGFNNYNELIISKKQLLQENYAHL